MGCVCGYLDIETTGLSPHTSELTVVGLYVVPEREKPRLFQPYGDQISSRWLKRALTDVDTVYTYNGRRFDLPFLEAKTGITIEKRWQHEDLMYACWRRGLYGGLKAVERLLGIGRTTTDIDGWMAVQLWRNYRFRGDRSSLERLLLYNKEDVMNLSKLRVKLSSVRNPACPPKLTLPKPLHRA